MALSAEQARAKKLAQLSALLQTPHAEEARSVWEDGVLPASPSAAASERPAQPKVVPLRILARGLDQGKSVRLPLSIAVRTCPLLFILLVLSGRALFPYLLSK